MRANNSETAADKAKVHGIIFVEHKISYKNVLNRISPSPVIEAWKGIEDMLAFQGS